MLKTGTRPLIVLGAFLGAGGIGWLSFIPAHGTWIANVFGPLEVMSFGLGFVFFGVTAAAQAGVPEHQAGLAAAMINASTWLGGALGVAIFSAIAASRTSHRLAAGARSPQHSPADSGPRYWLRQCRSLSADSSRFALATPHAAHLQTTTVTVAEGAD